MTDSTAISYTPNGIKGNNVAFRASSSLLLAMYGKTVTLAEADRSLEVLTYSWTDETITTSYKLSKYYDEFAGTMHEFHELAVEATYPDGQSSYLVHQLDDHSNSHMVAYYKMTTQMVEERDHRRKAAEQAGMANTFTVTDSNGEKYKSYVDLTAPDPGLQISILTAVVDAELNRLNS